MTIIFQNKKYLYTYESKVIAQTINIKLDKPFILLEFLYENNFLRFLVLHIDKLINYKDMNSLA